MSCDPAQYKAWLDEMLRQWLMEPGDWDRETRIMKMRQQWRAEIPHFIGRDPLTSVPYKRGPLPSVSDSLNKMTRPQ